MKKITISPLVPTELDHGFIPAALWNREYRNAVKANSEKVGIVIALERSNGAVSTYATSIFPHTEEFAPVNFKYVESIVKFLLWMKGGYRVTIAGCDKLAAELKNTYSPTGERSFDVEFMGNRIYGHPFEIVAKPLSQAPAQSEPQVKLGGYTDGCRVGFDLGGSDRKCAAVMNGEVIHTEEVVWDPYFQKDPEYHVAGIRDSIRRAAEKLPRVDAIGGSSAGVFVDNSPRVASLFRGLSKEDFDSKIAGLFHEIQKDYGVPLVVANDGEVTALAGSISLSSDSVLGLSMGTSTAAGYVNSNGNITDWLNELAFAPVDYRDDAPIDEWSGARGCGAQYFSQQGVARLAKLANINFPDDMPLPKRLEEIQTMMSNNDPRAELIYKTIGICFGYTIAHYSDFYKIKKLLILGRVTSGRGGEIIIEESRKVLEKEFPSLAKTIELRVPDEKFKRHGQAVIAAGLSEIPKS